MPGINTHFDSSNVPTVTIHSFNITSLICPDKLHQMLDIDIIFFYCYIFKKVWWERGGGRVVVVGGWEERKDTHTTHHTLNFIHFSKYLSKHVTSGHSKHFP